MTHQNPTPAGDGEGSSPSQQQQHLQHQQAHAGGQRPVRTLSLVKGPHRFCFRYEVGDESRVLDALVDMVNRREVPFDWFDAAVLSHQLGQHLAKELKGYLPKKAA
jgi:hypothetical protein